MNQDQKDNALKLIRKLIAKSSPSGLKFGLSTIIEVNSLRSLLDIECNFSHIIKAIKQTKTLSNFTVADFINIIRSYIDKEEELDRITVWEIIVPLDIEINKKKIRINETEFQILKYSSLKDFVKYDYFTYASDDKYRPLKIKNNLKSYLLCKSNGADLNKAWSNIEPSFIMLKGLVDFCLTKNQWIFISNTLARTKVAHPNLIFGRSNTKRTAYVEFLVNKNHNYDRVVKIDDNSIFFKLAEFLKSKPTQDTIGFLIADLLRLYSAAMDENLYQNSFLAFWQLIERITLSEPKGPSNENIKSRIKIFAQTLFGESINPYIEALSKKRNKLVHSGISEIEVDDINLLKIISEHAIQWIFKNRIKIKTCRHLELYYSSTLKNNSDLEISSEMTSFVMTKRK